MQKKINKIGDRFHRMTVLILCAFSLDDEKTFFCCEKLLLLLLLFLSWNHYLFLFILKRKNKIKNKPLM